MWGVEINSQSHRTSQSDRSYILVVIVISSARTSCSWEANGAFCIRNAQLHKSSCAGPVAGKPGNFNFQAHLPQLTAEVLSATSQCMGLVSDGVKAAVVGRNDKALQET